MVRKIEVTVPLDKAKDIESRLRRLSDVHHLYVYRGEDSALIVFKANEKKTSRIINMLSIAGVGVTFGTLDILSLNMTKPRLANHHPNERARRQYKLDDRMTVEEIHQFIDGQAHLTFDYLALIVTAALIAGVGLLIDSSVVIVASMLVSPLMGPIMALTFGFQVGDRELFHKGFRNELIGVLLTFACGIFVGLIVLPFDPEKNWVTQEMTSRGTWGALVAGVAVAIPSGAGVALSVTNGGISSLVGVAISASLLPPVVNSGIAFIFSVSDHLAGAKSSFANHMLEVAGYSLTLFFINWLLIFAVSLVFFRIKRIHPAHGQDARSIPTAIMPGDEHGEEYKHDGGGDDDDGFDGDASSARSSTNNEIRMRAVTSEQGSPSLASAGIEAGDEDDEHKKLTISADEDKLQV